MVVLLGDAPHYSPVPSIAIAPLRKDRRRTLKRNIIRALHSAANVSLNEKGPHLIAGDAHADVPEYTMESLELVHSARIRNDAPILPLGYMDKARVFEVLISLRRKYATTNAQASTP